MALKQSVYVLPDSPEAREDFEWLRTEIEDSGGEASVFVADAIDAVAEAELIDAFQRSRQAAYAALATALQRAQRTLGSRRQGARSARRDVLSKFRQRLASIEKTDHFGAPGRDRVLALLALADAGSATPRPQVTATSKTEFHKRVWVTRPVPGVDRMASAWLIRRFIDPDAQFAFASDPKAAPPHSVTFDMFGGEFSHRGELCTFEHLCERFAIDDPAVRRLAAAVHDVDLKDDKFGAPDAPTLSAAVDGLQLSCADDHALLQQGIALFEALYRAFARPAPRPERRRRPATRPK